MNFPLIPREAPGSLGVEVHKGVGTGTILVDPQGAPGPFGWGPRVSSASVVMPHRKGNPGTLGPADTEPVSTGTVDQSRALLHFGPSHRHRWAQVYE